MRFTLALLALGAIASAETGTLVIHSILHAVGEERYELSSVEGTLTLKTTLEYTDRTNKRTTGAELRMRADYAPLSLKLQGRPNSVESAADPLPFRKTLATAPSPHLPIASQSSALLPSPSR